MIAMGRLVFAGAFLVAATAVATAGPTRKVKVETDPDGAAVYLDDLDNGASCEATPCEFNAPLGSHVLIVRKNGFEPDTQELNVTKGKQPIKAKIKLSKAAGTIQLDSPKGAILRINDEDKGRAPVSVDAPAGEPLHIVVVANGKTLYDDVYELKSNEDYPVKPKSAAAAVAETATITEDPEEEGGGGGGGSGGGEGGSESIREAAGPRESLGSIVRIGLAFDVGLRSVSYSGVTTQNTLRTLNGGSQFMTGPAVEMWPGRMLHIKPLRGFSLFGRYEISPVAQVVSGENPTSLKGPVSSTWTSFEFSARERLQFGSIGVEASGGFVSDRFHFKTTSMDDFDAMPEADYSAVRLGGKLLFVSDQIEPYLAVENRIVISGGTLESRFAAAHATAFRAALGLGMKFGSIAGNIEGTYMKYSWALSNGSTQMPKWDATGASDSILSFSAVAGYQF